MSVITNLQFDRVTGVANWGQTNGETLDLLFAGDLCPRGRTMQHVMAGHSAKVLAPITAELSYKDLAVVNLEAPLLAKGTPIVKSGSNLKVDPSNIDLLHAGGWDVICCANNHIGDFGPEAALGTRDLLEKNGFQSVGVGVTLEDACRPLFVEKRGLRIAFLALAENEFGMATETAAGANPLRPCRNILQIKAAASQADLVIVLIHGGNEYYPLPSPRMVETYRAIVNAGAAAVVAGHSHCPQGIEIWEDAPIIYSLGNFLFDCRDLTAADFPGYNWWYGYQVRIGFVDGRATKLTVIPHTFSPCAERVAPLNGKEKADFLSYLSHISNLIRDENEIVKYFDAWCLRGIRGYYSMLNQPFEPVNWEATESIERLMVMRNLHTCEAHNELITATLRMVAERRLSEAEEYLSRLEVLIEGKLP